MIVTFGGNDIVDGKGGNDTHLSRGPERTRARAVQARMSSSARAATTGSKAKED